MKMALLLGSLAYLLHLQVPVLATDAPGDVDLSFAAQVPPLDGNIVRSLEPLPDGTVLVGGFFNGIGGQPRTNLARLKPDGSADPLFLAGLAGPDGPVKALRIYDSNRVLAGGSFGKFNGIPRPNLVRLFLDGSRDETFLSGMAGPNYEVNSITVTTNGEVYIRGAFNTINGIPRNGFARLKPDGSLDGSFNPVFATGPGAQASVSSFLLLPDQRLLVAGNFTSVNGTPRTNLAMLKADGTLDQSFHSGLVWTNGGGSPWLARQPDGRILCQGDYQVYTGPGGPFPSYPVFRLLSGGQVDPSFRSFSVNGQGGGYVAAAVVRPSGDFVLGGTFVSIFSPQPTGVWHFAAFKMNGTYDSTFLNGQAGPQLMPVDCLAQQTDGTMYVGGRFTTFNGVDSPRLVRLRGDLAPLQFTQEPGDQTVEVGATASFHTRVAGYPQPAFQWFFNGQATTELHATNTQLALSPVQYADSGQYRVLARNALMSITSAPAALSVIAPVDRRLVPGVRSTANGEPDETIDYADPAVSPWHWERLTDCAVQSGFSFDLTSPAAERRIYRSSHTNTAVTGASLLLQLIPSITITGDPGTTQRLDFINAQGPTNAWQTLAVLPLTNPPQVYFDTTAPGQPARVYRIIPLP